MEGNTIQRSLDAAITDTGGTVQSVQSQGASRPQRGSVVGEHSGQTAGRDDGEAGGAGVEGEVI